jgi:hypothetical protein
MTDPLVTGGAGPFGAQFVHHGREGRTGNGITDSRTEFGYASARAVAGYFTALQWHPDAGWQERPSA